MMSSTRTITLPLSSMFQKAAVKPTPYILGTASIITFSINVSRLSLLIIKNNGGYPPSRVSIRLTFSLDFTYNISIV